MNRHHIDQKVFYTDPVDVHKNSNSLKCVIPRVNLANNHDRLNSSISNNKNIQRSSSISKIFTNQYFSCDSFTGSNDSKTSRRGHRPNNNNNNNVNISNFETILDTSNTTISQKTKNIPTSKIKIRSDSNQKERGKVMIPGLINNDNISITHQHQYKKDSVRSGNCSSSRQRIFDDSQTLREHSQDNSIMGNSRCEYQYSAPFEKKKEHGELKNVLKAVNEDQNIAKGKIPFETNAVLSCETNSSISYGVNSTMPNGINSVFLPSGVISSIPNGSTLPTPGISTTTSTSRNINYETLQKLQDQYRNLLLAYENLVSNNTELEKSLRNETITCEEQRAYIECLKQHMEKILDHNQILPYFKKNMTYRGVNEGARSHSNLPKSTTNTTTTAGVSTITSSGGEKYTERSMIIEGYIDFVEMRESIESYKTLEKEYKNQIKGLQKDLDGMKDDKINNENKIIELNELNSKLENDVRRLIESYDVIQQENLKLTQEKDQLLDFIDKKMPSIEKNEELSQEFKKEKSILMKMLKEKESEINSIQTTNKDYSQKIKTLQEQLEIAQENYFTISITLNETQADLERTNEKLTSLEVSISQLRERNALVENEKNLLRKQFDSLNQEKANLERSANDLKTTLAEKEKSLLELSNTINEFKRLLKTKEELLIEQQHNTMNEIADLNKDKIKLQAENEKLNNEIMGLNCEIDNKKKTITSLSGDISALSKQLAEKDKTLYDMLNENTRKDKKATMEIDISSKNSHIAESNLITNRPDSNRRYQGHLNKRLMEMNPSNENDMLLNYTELKQQHSLMKDYLLTIRKEIRKLMVLYNHTQNHELINEYQSKILNNSTSSNKPEEISSSLKTSEIEQAYKEICKCIELSKCELNGYNKLITELKTEIMTLGNKITLKNTENSKAMNDLLNQKVIALEYENKVLNDELTAVKLSQYSSNPKESVSRDNTNSLGSKALDNIEIELKTKLYLIRKYKNFIFDLEILDLIDELGKVQIEILQYEAKKNKTATNTTVSTTSNSIGITTNDQKLDNSPKRYYKKPLAEHYMSNESISSLPSPPRNASFGGCGGGSGGCDGASSIDIKGFFSQQDERYSGCLEILKAKRTSLEGELYKLEIKEKRRYDANCELQKQNFEVRNYIMFV